MQEELKRIKDSLNEWTESLTKALDSNSSEDIKELVKETRKVESACDQLIYSLSDLKEVIEEYEYLK